MPDDIEEDIVVNAGSKSEDSRGGWSARGSIDEEVEEGAIDHTEGKGARQDEPVSDGGRGGRVLPESVQKRIDEMAARTRGEAPKPAADVVEEEKPAEVEAKPDDAAPKEEAPKTETVDERDTRITALSEANARLLSELEAEKAKPRSAPAKHHARAGQAAESYIEDPMAALRHLVAASLDIDDVADKRIDDEIRLLYTELTAHAMGVTPDDNHIAKRDAARARQLVAREKRERLASSEKTTAPADVDRAVEAAAFIGNRLTAKNGDGTSIADKYPLVMSLAEDLEGQRPEAALWRTLERESKTGRIVLHPTDDDANIAQAAQLLEQKYEALINKGSSARKPKEPPSQTPPSTAPPSAPPKASSPTRQDAARTLTNADASVAPATPPAPKSAKTEKPKFKTRREAQDYAMRHFDK